MLVAVAIALTLWLVLGLLGSVLFRAVGNLVVEEGGDTADTFRAPPCERETVQGT